MPIPSNEMNPCLHFGPAVFLLLFASTTLEWTEAFSPGEQRSPSFLHVCPCPGRWAASRIRPLCHDRSRGSSNEGMDKEEDDDKSDGSGFGSAFSQAKNLLSQKGQGASVVNADDAVAASATMTSRISRLAKQGASDVKKVAGVAGSGLASLAEKGTSGVQKVTSVAGSSLASLAEKGTTDVQKVAGVAGSGLASLAEKGTTNAQKVAGVAGSSLLGMAEKGTSDVKNVASVASSSLSSMAEKGSTNVRSAASAARSGLTEFVQKGNSDATQVVEWLDAQAKGGAEAASTHTRALVLNFTGKSEYRFGDITTELMRRAATASESTNLQDILLLLKVLLAVGASIGPLTKILPATVLVQTLNVSLETRLGEAILKALAGSLDERFSAALTANEIGDLAKRSMTGAILHFTGKDSYEKGDIERAVTGETNDDDTSGKTEACNVTPSKAGSPVVPPPPPPKTLELSVGQEFAEWDQMFRDQHPAVEMVLEKSLETATAGSGASRKALDMEIVSELEEWDVMFREKYPDTRL